MGSKPLSHAEKNELADALDAIPNNADPLTKIKMIVAASLKYATEEERVEILAEMENGGYEHLMHMLANVKIPEGFDPKNRPWNRN